MNHLKKRRSKRRILSRKKGDTEGREECKDRLVVKLLLSEDKTGQKSKHGAEADIYDKLKEKPVSTQFIKDPNLAYSYASQAAHRMIFVLQL